MLHGSGLPILFVITPAWRHFLVACYSEASLFSCCHTYVSRGKERVGSFGCLTKRRFNETVRLWINIMVWASASFF